MSSTPKTFSNAQDSLRVAAVIGSMQTAANFNGCKINVLFNFINYFQC